MLSQITYPSGGWVKYTWGANAQAATDWFPDSHNDANFWSGGMAKSLLLVDRQLRRGTHGSESDVQYSTTWNGNQVGWISKQTTVTTNDVIRGTLLYYHLPLTRRLHLENRCRITSTTIPSRIRPYLPSRQLLTAISMDRPSEPRRSLVPTRSSSSLNRCPSTAAPPSTKTYTYGTGGVLTEENDYDFGSSTRCERRFFKVSSVRNNTPVSNGLDFRSALPSPHQDGSGTRYAEKRTRSTTVAAQYSVCTAGTPSVSTAVAAA